jgi:hypothetical protein
MRTSPRTCVLLLLILGVGGAEPVLAQATRPGVILGWWHGTSTCVKAPWNSACNDEDVLYEFVPASPDSLRSTLHAFKVVGGERDSMGDLPITFLPDAQAWEADITTRRGGIRWTFRLRGDTLVGQLVLRPDMQVARHVVALRGSGR